MTKYNKKNEQIMRYDQTVQAGLAALVLFGVSACVDGTQPGNASFKKQYFVAREALETGDYDRASRSYARLLGTAGPFEPRVRLEYAHSLLRAGDFDDAAVQARQLSRTQNGTARSAALAVQATAEHEMALAALDAGNTPQAKTLLAQAAAGIAEVLKQDPSLDPLGALKERQAMIRTQLRALG